MILGFLQCLWLVQCGQVEQAEDCNLQVKCWISAENWKFRFHYLLSPFYKNFFLLPLTILANDHDGYSTLFFTWGRETRSVLGDLKNQIDLWNVKILTKLLQRRLAVRSWLSQHCGNSIQQMNCNYAALGR